MRILAGVCETRVQGCQPAPVAQDRREITAVRTVLQRVSGVWFRAGFLLMLGFLRAQAATEESGRTNLPAASIRNWVMDLDAGRIEITPADRPEIQIEWVRTARGRGAGREREILTDCPVRFHQESNTWTLTALSGPSTPAILEGARPTLSGVFRVQLPVECGVSVRTRAGSIHVAGLKGRIRAETVSGGLQFSRITGDITGETGSGPVQIDGCVGVCNVVSRGGGIQVEAGSGTLHVETSGGSILVRQFRGAVHAETDGGGLRFIQVPGPVVGLTGSGSVAAEFVRALSGPVRLETGGGGITVRIPRMTGFDLDAQTAAGSVLLGLGKPTSESAPTDTRKEKVNGGGPEVRLRTSAGSIRIIGTDSTPAPSP